MRSPLVGSKLVHFLVHFSRRPAKPLNSGEFRPVEAMVADDANDDDSDSCTNACTNAACGDGIQGPGEACDDGNQIDDDLCTNLCALASCGDGLVQPGEECDDANEDETDACLSTCLGAKCGDGAVWAEMEECDDANNSYSSPQRAPIPGPSATWLRSAFCGGFSAPPSATSAAPRVRAMRVSAPFSATRRQRGTILGSHASFTQSDKPQPSNRRAAHAVATWQQPRRRGSLVDPTSSMRDAPARCWGRPRPPPRSPSASTHRATVAKRRARCMKCPRSYSLPVKAS
ncbi:MAG: DUF4215 domain-containing protein [Nannocystis sp.]|nr:DUF4215 domain-containing protein [Nannocystis sp.]